MKFIVTIVVIALSGATVCTQDFGSYMTRTANTNTDHSQSDSSTYLMTFNMQQPLEKLQIFQTTMNSQQNDVPNYRVQRPSAFIPPKIGSSTYGQPPSTPYSIPRPISSQQYLSRYMPQGFRGLASYNPRLNQLSYSSVFLPLNIPKSSSAYLSLQSPLFPSISPRALCSVIRIRRQLGRYTGGNEGIELFRGGVEYEAQFFPPPDIKTTKIASDGLLGIDGSSVEYDLDHPPHIHNLDVKCSKTMMTVNIEFDRIFDGIIYSKGYFMNPECTYVKQNSGSTQYSFTVNLDSCGTQFINDFEGAAGQAYLENVLVLQNEPGIQEVWDTVRRVRCLWEGNINKILTVNLSVDMLNQEIVTFSGDTAIAKLDIQIGKGPFAPVADGLVKIGEIMTLVVSVEGDPDFDLQVRDCSARDEVSTNMLQLTDERGCILKPKLFGAFQKTRNPDSTGTSIIAYAFFQAFKFPDIMDLFIECNVELCKTNCEPCPEANQQIEPGIRRRSITYASPSNNSSNLVLLSDPVRVGQRFKVIMLDDLNVSSNQILDSMEETAVEAIIKTKKMCMSNSRFYMTFFLMLSILFIATINAAVLYIKLQRIRRAKFVDS